MTVQSDFFIFKESNNVYCYPTFHHLQGRNSVKNEHIKNNLVCISQYLHNLFQISYTFLI